MAGKFGVSSIKNLMTTGKIAAISVIQAVAKDGFQASDLLAPLSSPSFQARLESAIIDFRGVIPEISELDVWDGLDIGKHAWACWADLKTEFELAQAKLVDQKKAA
jgi:hypothetical protein